MTRFLKICGASGVVLSLLILFIGDYLARSDGFMEYEGKIELHASGGKTFSMDMPPHRPLAGATFAMSLLLAGSGFWPRKANQDIAQ